MAGIRGVAALILAFTQVYTWFVPVYSVAYRAGPVLPISELRKGFVRCSEPALPFYLQFNRDRTSSRFCLGVVRPQARRSVRGN